MRASELKPLIGRIDQYVAWKPSQYSGGGIARVLILEVGLADPKRHVEPGYHDHCRVQIVSSAGIPIDAFDRTERVVPSRELHKWTDEQERAFSLTTDREAFSDDMRQAAGRVGIIIKSVDPIKQTVTLTGDEFSRLCIDLDVDADEQWTTKMVGHAIDNVPENLPPGEYQTRIKSVEPDKRGGLTVHTELEKGHGGDAW